MSIDFYQYTKVYVALIFPLLTIDMLMVNLDEETLRLHFSLIIFLERRSKCYNRSIPLFISHKSI